MTEQHELVQQALAAARRPLIALVGPTAAGKTQLSLALARRFAGEIVSADSRLFYRQMDIGTAKPTPNERERVPHHLIDIREPDEPLTLGEYRRVASDTIAAVHGRGRLPLLVGGTGQYVMAVLEGWGIPEVPPHPLLRRTLRRLGRHELARWLAVLDPAKAEELDSRNIRRVVRALEVALISGRSMTDLQKKTPPPYDSLMIGLECERSWLYERIDARVDRMMADGLLDEVKALKEAGYSARLPALSGLGYRQLYAHLNGEMSLDVAVERMKNETHRLARQQGTWFRKDDKRIHWLRADASDLQAKVETLVTSWLAGD